MKIVNTDAFGGDYPNEFFINLPSLTKECCQEIADIVNGAQDTDCSRYWKVVPDDYKLQPGFEP